MVLSSLILTINHILHSCETRKGIGTVRNPYEVRTDIGLKTARAACGILNNFNYVIGKPVITWCVTDRGRTFGHPYKSFLAEKYDFLY